MALRKFQFSQIIGGRPLGGQKGGIEVDAEDWLFAVLVQGGVLGEDKEADAVLVQGLLDIEVAEGAVVWCLHQTDKNKSACVSICIKWI